MRQRGARPDGNDRRKAQRFGAELRRLVFELGRQFALGHLRLDHTTDHLERSLGLATSEPSLLDFVAVFHNSQLLDEAIGRKELNFRQRFGERPLKSDGCRVRLESQPFDFASIDYVGDDGKHPLTRAADSELEPRALLGELRRVTGVGDERFSVWRHQEIAVVARETGEVGHVFEIGDQ